MPSRNLLAAAVLAAAVAALTSCTSQGATSAAAPGPATSAPAPTAPAPTTPGVTDPVPASPAPSSPAAPGAPSASTPGDLPLDPEPSFDCVQHPLAANHQVVQVTGAPAGGSLPARVAKFVCDPNGGGYAGAGAVRRFPLAADVTAELNAAGTYHKVSPADLGKHINACLHHGEVQPPLSCSGDLYDITVTDSGAVSDIREIWHP
jgi:hypothetical protein